MADPRITYNSKTVDPGKQPRDFKISVTVPRTITTSLSGDVETLIDPRVDISVMVNFPLIDSLTLRNSFDQWWQWAHRGNVWTYAHDSAKTVNTTLSGNEAAGQTVVTVASATGIVSGQTYKLISGPYYQLVTVTNISGSDITVNSLDYAFPAGAIFRDQFYFPAVIRDPGARSPIIDRDAGVRNAWPITRFDLFLEFMELTV